MGKLGNYVNIKTGKLDANASSENGKYPFFTCAIQPLKINSYSYDCECVLVAGNGDLNVKYYNGKFDAYQRTYIIESLDKSILAVPYLYYFLDKYVETLRIQSIGGVIKYIKLRNLTEAQIFLPNLQTQYDIVTKISKLKDLIALRKKQLEKLDELVKSHFIEMFGESRTNSKEWDIIKLEEFSSVGSSKRVFVEELKKEGIPFYRGTEVGALAIGEEITPEFFITEEHYKILCKASGTPVKGDLLMPSICPDGRIWLVNNDKPFYFKDGRVLWIHSISKKVNNCYLQYALKEKFITEYKNIASGTTFAELKIFSLKILPVMIPPINLQEEFANFITKVDKQKLTIQQSLDKLEVLKKALIQQYFE